MVLSLQLGSGDDAVDLASDGVATDAYLASISAHFDPAFECTMRFPGMQPVLYRGGVDALRASWEDRLRHWAEYRVELQGVIDAETRIVVFHRACVRGAAQSPETVLETASVWSVSDHRLMRADFNLPAAEARAIAYSITA